VYLLDTNICIALLSCNRQVELRFARMFPQCYTSTLVVAELYKGIYGSERIEQNLTALETFIELLGIEVFDRAAAEEFGKIQAELKQLSRPTGMMDALIAAVARSRADVVVTHNIRDFEHILGLLLENWIED
jgi:tRNA(fMet)-specific endonuclease VapC